MTKGCMLVVGGEVMYSCQMNSVREAWLKISSVVDYDGD